MVSTKTHRLHRWALRHSLPILLRVLRRLGLDVHAMHSPTACFQDFTLRTCRSFVACCSCRRCLIHCAVCSVLHVVGVRLRVSADASERLAVRTTLSHTSRLVSRASRRRQSIVVCEALELDWSTRPWLSQGSDNISSTIHAGLHSLSPEPLPRHLQDLLRVCFRLHQVLHSGS